MIKMNQNRIKASLTTKTFILVKMGYCVIKKITVRSWLIYASSNKILSK